ncbi:MAG: GNAT family N-acetyltransferase [Chloroflexota bacterium]
MRIFDLTDADEPLVEQAAALLVDGFRESFAWPDRESALEEVRASFGTGKISLVAVDDDGAVLGWIGGVEQYDGHVWELGPLVVRPDRQRQGIGRALVLALEARVRERGALTLWVATDDETDATTLSGVDLYPDVLAHLAAIRNLRRHPYEFYQKLGFTIVGVLPDADGIGKPDIFLAKRVARLQR